LDKGKSIRPRSKKANPVGTLPEQGNFDLIKKGAEDEISTVFKNVVDNAFTYAMISDTQQMDTTKGHCSGHTMLLQATIRM
jgi:hypothetical protein